MTVVSNYIDQLAHDFVTGLQLPELRSGILTPDGDAFPWKDLAIGSQWHYANDASPEWVKLYRKFANNQRDDDWAMGLHVLQQRFSYTDFTDGGGAAGTLALTETIPIGAFVLRATVQNLTGFTGDTSAVITVGDGSDVDRYNAGTPSVFTTANAVDLGAPSGTQIHTTAATVTLTITSATDWGAVVAGAGTIRIYMLA